MTTKTQTNQPYVEYVTRREAAAILGVSLDNMNFTCLKYGVKKYYDNGKLLFSEKEIREAAEKRIKSIQSKTVWSAKEFKTLINSNNLPMDPELEKLPLIDESEKKETEQTIQIVQLKADKDRLYKRIFILERAVEMLTKSQVTVAGDDLKQLINRN